MFLNAATAFMIYSAVRFRNGHQSPPMNKDKPILTVAGIVHVCPENKIALIERGKKPFGKAMFGGHVEAKESPDYAFLRELKEELQITKVDSYSLIGVHGDYGRDPRQHSVEVTYAAVTHQRPKAASDAKSVKLHDVDALKKELETGEFAFDHGKIMQKYFSSAENCNPCKKKFKP